MTTSIKGKRVALLGLAFKPGTDDLRAAPALRLASRLMEEGAHVVGYDPEATANAKAEMPQLETAPDPYGAATGAHCVVFCTEWDELRSLDLRKLKEVMTYPVIVDGRNLFDASEIEAAGFTYSSIGRPTTR